MRLLLDTHIFIWWADEPERLGERLLDALLDIENELILSVVSLWEMQIKAQLGKLTLRRPLKELVHLQQSVNGLQLLPVTSKHVFLLDELPLVHKDPLDRLIIAQALAENLTLVSHDRVFEDYQVLLWKPDMQG